jgi:hypothetical protein
VSGEEIVVPRKTLKQLEAQVHDLEAYMEAVICWRKGETPELITWTEPDDEGGEVEHSLETLGLHRGSGGVILEGTSVTWVSVWTTIVSLNNNPYRREVAMRISKATRAALERVAAEKRSAATTNTRAS